MIHVVAAIIEDSERCVFVGRRAAGSYARTWEFPGGKVEPGETDMDALERELREEGVIEPDGGIKVLEVHPTLRLAHAQRELYEITHLRVSAFKLTARPPVSNFSHTAFAWKTWESLRSLQVRHCSPGLAAFLGALT